MDTPWLTPDMGERFRNAGWQPIELEGRLVHPMLRLTVEDGESISIGWVSVASPRSQGLVMRLRHPEIRGAKGRGGMLRAAGTESPVIGLWSETAANPTRVEVAHVAPGAELQISNQWRTEDGRVDEWFQNYGMLIEVLGEGQYILRCSDGMHPAGPTFDDLVARIGRSVT
jgi:hypothetical protein